MYSHPFNVRGLFLINVPRSLTVLSFNITFFSEYPVESGYFGLSDERDACAGTATSLANPSCCNEQAYVRYPQLIT